MRVSQANPGISQITQEQEQGGSIEAQMRDILASYKGDKDELIPILQQVQQQFGYLPEQAISYIARFVNLPESIAFGVATFYAQFKLMPTGRKVVKICRGTGCYVRGAPRILSEAEKQLGIKPGETTPDLEYTLETVACFGCCALAPVLVVNDKVYGRMTTSEVEKVVGKDTDK